MAADTLLADKAFDADERVINLLHAAGKTAVIPPKSNRKVQREFDNKGYKARASAGSSNIVPSPRVTTKPRETSLLQSTSRLLQCFRTFDRLN